MTADGVGRKCKKLKTLLDFGAVSGFDTRNHLKYRPMTTNFLGKMLFPRLQPWQQRRQAKTLLLTLLVSVVFACVVATVIYLGNTHR